MRIKQKRAIRRMRRRHQRAWIVLDSVEGKSKSECEVMDISSDGARLVIASGLSVPKHFGVALVPNSAPRECERVWRNGEMMGIRFTEPR
ncbi:hypothetical protein NB311A_00735 [Nitrobacter sp. Nb-311A]|nr:hypothetical protein NB311A_00735 [Nitrobacter sp. Nb-311A]MCB1394070.1 hypothetical protein [Nitrobacter sp.]MCV0387606.1 hypothetical protein [Nitrobacter sp.]